MSLIEQHKVSERANGSAGKAAVNAGQHAAQVGMHRKRGQKTPPDGPPSNADNAHYVN